MRCRLLCCASLLVLGACASHAPRCDSRLRPINAVPIAPGALWDDRRPAPRAPKAARS